MKRLFWLFLMITVAVPAFAAEPIAGWCEKGNETVTLSGLTSTTRVQRSYPSCTVTVYRTGTVTLATLYSDAVLTPLANPFTSAASGRWTFYANGGGYDVVISGGGLTTPFTFSDLRTDNSVFNVTTFGARCDGSTSDNTAVNNARAAATAQTNGGTVLFPGVGACVINSISFDSDVTLQFEGGGLLSIASGMTATIAGTIVAPSGQRIFTGSGNVVVSPGQTAEYSVNWWGALGDGLAASAATNSTTIQSAVTSVCGGTSATIPISQATSGAHGALKFLPGAYITTSDIVIPSACWADISGASGKGTYVFMMTGGTTAAITIQGSECLACEAPPRTASNNDAEVHLHDMSIGSSTGHALQLLRAYRTRLTRINLFSADVADNYLEVDGVSTLVADDVRITGNEDFPYGQYPIFGNGDAFEQGVYGIHVTVNAGPTAGDYNNSGELWFNRPWVQGQQTADAIFVDIPTADPINVYPIHINSADLVVANTFAGIRVNGQSIVLVDGATFIECSGTSDAIRAQSTQGNATTLESSFISATNIVAPSCRANLAGDGTRKPNMVAHHNWFSTFVSASAVYGRLELTSNEFTSNTASAYANYTDGNSTYISGNTVRTGTNPTVVYPWNAAFSDFAGETDPLVSQYTYAAAASSAPIINCRKSRGTLQAPGAVLASDATCGFNFYGYSNGGWRDGGSFQSTVTAVSGSNLTGRLTFRLPAAGTSTVMLTLNPTNVVIGATDSSSTALLNVNGGYVHIGSGSWPTVSLSQTANNVLMSQAATQALIMYRSDTTVGTNYGANIFMGARQTDSTDNFAGARFAGGRENATSGNASAFATIATTNSGGTFVEALRIDSAQLTALAAGLTVTGAVTFVALTSASTGGYVCWNAGTVTQSSSCSLSSERYKHDIQYNRIPGMELVRTMKPISFVSNIYPELGVQFGFKAEDVARTERRLVSYDKEGRPNGFAYENYTAILTKAMQELDERVRRLEGRR